MASRGYQAIEDPPSETLKNAYSSPSSTAAMNSAEEGTNHAQGGKSNNPVDNATNLVANIKQNAQSIITSDAPAINFYTDPLNPSTSMSLKDRVSLVLESARPWSEFFDLRQVR